MYTARAKSFVLFTCGQLTSIELAKHWKKMECEHTHRCPFIFTVISSGLLTMLMLLLETTFAQIVFCSDGAMATP